ncbi:MAG: hypothetical protein OEY34_09575, partial [Cyclobacteriaceae bacterium]|nr:hypothetical protein [Cyclobacteriaceae bacterium]
STARAWFTEDTLIHKNNWKMEFRPFTMIYDKSCGEGIVGENSTDYTLILNYTYLTKFNIREAPLFHKEHENFINEIIKTGNVVLWGILDNTDGTIVLMKGTTDPAIFSLDPMVQSGFIEPETKDVIINSTLPCK